ncbi:ABC-type multidrug transport system permease subunit [Sulfitobacter undariae]|uniref:ABC-type multidrug transport system permease subunit n=1 Tax=Sulfitobacter undariae TaxID=1563671 RepID=A0A7W6E6V3_9RHOB|nr:YIP1 family protein [Sulfitobacter undariae]MBB3995830.1 ABC-type multidrug transport system permease subunit [Sulfitobacter undariae]
MFARFLGQGRNEVRTLLFVLIAGLLMFVAWAPFQAREAQINPDAVPLQARMYWSAFFFIFMMPLLVYVFAALVTGLARVARRQITGYEIRFTLVWALLAATPVTLLMGLTAAFVGAGIQLQIIGFIWLAVFGWFWVSGLLRADGTQS